eukprot:1194363-Prorocentrum_minimum.AAC.1
MGEFCGDMGEFSGDMGEFSGDMGEFSGDMGEYSSRPMVAVRHWGRGVERRALAAWVGDTRRRVHKRDMMLAALQVYERRLLTEGAGGWLRTGVRRRQLRLQAAVEQQASQLTPPMSECAPLGPRESPALCDWARSQRDKNPTLQL